MNDPHNSSVLAASTIESRAATGIVYATRGGGRVIIRLASPAEYDELGEFCEAAYANDYTLSDSYRGTIRNVAGRAATSMVWVARNCVPGKDGTEDGAQGEIVASVTTPHPGANISDLGRPGELDFRLLAVSPDARGRGLGELLTRFVIALAEERGNERVVLNSGVLMTGAHRLYEKIGFTRALERESDIVGDNGVVIHILAFTYDITGDASAIELIA